MMMVDATVIDPGGRISWELTTGSRPSLKKLIALHEGLCDHPLVCGARLSLLKKRRTSELAPRL